MKFRTRPCLPGTFVVPNPFRYFELDGDVLSFPDQDGTMGRAHSGRWTLEFEQTPLQRAFNLGDILIELDAGHELPLRFRVKNAMNFRATREFFETD